jgi:hypothetical protein
MFNEAYWMNHFEDMSPWAVHFTRSQIFAAPLPAPGPAEQGMSRQEFAARMERLNEESSPGYNRMMSILWDGTVDPFEEPHGAGKDVPEVAETHRSAAFSEVPLHLLDRLIAGRSEFGIGFPQEFLLAHGGGRVWYLEADGAPADAIRRQVAERQNETVDPSDAFWAITPFIDFPDASVPFGDWRSEREWRVPGGLHFRPSDVAFLFLPERFHDDARRFFAEHRAANTGPSYLCPYIDMTWDHDIIQARLQQASSANGWGASGGYSA